MWQVSKIGVKPRMSAGIVYSEEPVTLVGAGILGENDLDLCLGRAPTLVAADGGVLHCLPKGILPFRIIGDFDSLPADILASLPDENLLRITEQDSTDFDKALRHIEAPLVVGVGFSGARIDHQLACYNALLRHPNRRCVLISDTDIVFLCPPELQLDLEDGQRFSIFPMGSVQGTSKGLRWPIDGLHFAPDGQIGTSNEVVGPVTITADSAKMLLILPRTCLDQVVTALAAQPGSWSAL